MGVEDRLCSLKAYLCHFSYLFLRLERVLTRNTCGIRGTTSFVFSFFGGLWHPSLNSSRGDIGGVRTYTAAAYLVFRFALRNWMMKFLVVLLTFLKLTSHGCFCAKSWLAPLGETFSPLLQWKMCMCLQNCMDSILQYFACSLKIAMVSVWATSIAFSSFLQQQY